MTNQPSTPAATANGTLTQNTQRQSRRLSSTPPTIGPMLTPTACAAAMIPIARSCLSGPADWTRITMALALSIAPAKPSSVRSAISCGRSEAKPHHSESAANRAKPSR